MKRFLAPLFAAFYLAAVVAAQASGFLIDSYKFAAVGATPSITFLQCSSEDTTDQTTYTFASQNTGTASADRYTVVAVAARDATGTYNVSSLTVGGDAATAVENVSAPGVRFSGLFILANPAGTSESVAVTMSEPIVSMVVCLWQVNNIASSTAVASTTVTSAGSGAAATLDINVSALGVALGVCASTNSALTYVWAGFTERFDAGGTEQSWSAADFTNDASADTPLAISATPSTGQITCSTASFL